jgi:putative protease
MLTPQDNVTNSLSRAFYADHGVVDIAEGLDCRATMAGECVMQSSYCIRREIGECLLQHPKYRGKLYLVRGSKRYALRFDCKACKMMVFEE